MGNENIITAISALADSPHPESGEAAKEIRRLAIDEFDQFVSSAKARLKGIQGLNKIVDHDDFRKKRSEKTIQKLFETCPWLVDPTYTQFLSADVSLGK